MKLFFASLMMFAVSQVSQASLFSCEDVVQFAVEREARDQGLNDVVANVTQLPEAFNELRLFRVITQKPGSDIGIPYSATWLVVARDIGGTAGCISAQVTHDMTAL